MIFVMPSATGIINSNNFLSDLEKEVGFFEVILGFDINLDFAKGVKKYRWICQAVTIAQHYVPSCCEYF
jgi:hypothetical protein